MELSPAKILVIHFGQLGDVILSLQALGAIAERFPDARRTALVGAACADVVRMSGLFDEVVGVDRVALRDGGKLRSIAEILKLARRVRRERFDFVIDLHSLPETNILGYVSGAGSRLFANRESRSLDRLSNFRPRPPKEDKAIHASEVYLEALTPLGIDRSNLTKVILEPFVDALTVAREKLPTGSPLIGLNPGAGHPLRRWPAENFCELAERLAEQGTSVAIFLGPEEKEIRGSFEGTDRIKILDDLTLQQFMAALSQVDIMIGNDTGPMHLANAVGAKLVVLAHTTAAYRFLPRGENVTILRGENLEAISVDDTLAAIWASLQSGQPLE